MRKIEDTFSIKNAADAMKAARENGSDNEKVAMNINVGPATVIGALTGAAIGINNNRKRTSFEEEYNQIRNSTPRAQKPSLIKGHYAQVDAVAKNLRVVFTPVSVIYIVKHGLKNIPIETINTDAMDNTMYNAWKNKNEEFFRKMLLNKMLVEINFAENMFAKDIINNQLQITNNVLKRNNKMQKKASISNICEFFEKTAEIKETYSSMSDKIQEKMASILVGVCDDGSSVEISWGFDGEAEKYAALGNVDDVFGVNFSADRIRNLEKKLSNASYLRQNVDIGFLPDRVVYIVDNTVVSTFPILEMSQESFEAFKKKDKVYFNRAFAREVEKGKKTLKKIASDEGGGVDFETEKLAANRLISAPKSTAFRMSGISPYVYYKILKKRYSYKWNEMDMAALIKIIEQDFKLEGIGIADIPLNKIMSIYACISEETANSWTNPLAFEKIIRSFNDLPIDFLSSERESMTVNELVYGIVCYSEIMHEREKDAFKLFSDEIRDYVAEFLFERDIVVLYPKIVESETAMEFYGDINSRILRRLIEKNNLLKDDMESQEYKLAVQNEILQPLAVDILTKMRDNNVTEEMSSESIEEIAKEYQLDIDKEALLRRQIRINIEVDQHIESKIELTGAQLSLYNLE